MSFTPNCATHDFNLDDFLRLAKQLRESRKPLTIAEFVEARKGDIQPILDRSFAFQLLRGRMMILGG